MELQWEYFIVPLTWITVQILKQLEFSNRWLPLIATVLGGVYGAAFALVYGGDWFARVVFGVISGASASGLYDAGKNTVQQISSKIHKP